MPESATAGDGDPLAGFRFGLLDPLIGRDASADQWGSIQRREAGRYMGDVVRVCEEVIGKAAVFGIAAELGFRANGLPSRSNNTRNGRTPSRARAPRPCLPPSR